LEQHDFFKHIFPQITRFFAFFRNTTSRNNLIDKLFQLVKSNPSLEEEFRKHLGRRELYKALKDIIENSQNILLIIDDNKPEFHDIFETYTDTWDKMVKVEILKQYTANGETIFTMNPDFEDIGFIEPPTHEEAEGEERYTESFKDEMARLDSNIRINPQRYYISLRKNRNFAYLKFRKRKMHIVVMIPYEDGASLIQKHKLTQLSEGIQKFYNGACFQVTLENKENLDEIMRVLEEAYKLQN
jgi:predicted transport protein